MLVTMKEILDRAKKDNYGVTKTIIAIALVAVIVGGFIFLQVKNRKK